MPALTEAELLECLGHLARSPRGEGWVRMVDAVLDGLLAAGWAQGGVGNE